MKTFWIVLCALIVCCAIVHRRVIAALIKGNEMPKAPKWHIWLAEDKKRKER